MFLKTVHRRCPFRLFLGVCLREFEPVRNRNRNLSETDGRNPRCTNTPETLTAGGNRHVAGVCCSHVGGIGAECLRVCESLCRGCAIDIVWHFSSEVRSGCILRRFAQRKSNTGLLLPTLTLNDFLDGI